MVKSVSQNKRNSPYCRDARLVRPCNWLKTKCYTGDAQTVRPYISVILQHFLNFFNTNCQNAMPIPMQARASV